MARVKFTNQVEYQSLVGQRMRIVYVPTPKVACTSLKWAMAEAEGTRRDVFVPGTGPGGDASIHSPLNHGLRALSDLSGSLRQQVLESDEWIRFCVIRSPYERLLSAWLDRVLLQIRHPLDLLPDGGFDYGVAFRSFARDFDREHPVWTNPHFTSQNELLDPHHFPFTHVVELGGLPQFVDAIQKHGGARTRFALGDRRNITLALRPEHVFDADTARHVESVYADDFETFGYTAESFPEVAAPMRLTDNELRLVHLVRERDQVIKNFRDDLFSVRHLGTVVRGVKSVLHRRFRTGRPR